VYQFGGHFQVGVKDGFVGMPASIGAGQPPVPVAPVVCLQGANVGQPLQQRGKHAQRALPEVVRGLEHHRAFTRKTIALKIKFLPALVGYEKNNTAMPRPPLAALFFWNPECSQLNADHGSNWVLRLWP
jgi:hypothetical protein